MPANYERNGFCVEITFPNRGWVDEKCVYQALRKADFRYHLPTYKWVAKATDEKEQEAQGIVKLYNHMREVQWK
jgi:hypothetical protein